MTNYLLKVYCTMISLCLYLCVSEQVINWWPAGPFQSTTEFQKVTKNVLVFFNFVLFECPAPKCLSKKQSGPLTNIVGDP